MKCFPVDFAGRRHEPLTPAEAVEAVVDREAALAEGTVEVLQAKVQALTQLVGRLVGMGLLGSDQVAEVLGYGYEVEHDQ